MPASMPTSTRALKDLSVRTMSEDGLFDSSSESELIALDSAAISSTHGGRDATPIATEVSIAETNACSAGAEGTTKADGDEDSIMTEAPPDSESELSGTETSHSTPTHSPHHPPTHSRRHIPTSTHRINSPALTAKLASAKKALAVVHRDLARKDSSVAILTKWSDSAKHALALSRADIDALTEALHACMRRLHEMTVEAGDLNDELAETRRMLRKVQLGRAKERERTRDLRGRLKKMRVEVNMNRLGMSRPEEKARYVSTETDTEMTSQPQPDPSLAPSPPAVPSAPPPEPSSTSRPPVSFPASVTAPAAPPSLTPTDAVHMLTALNAQILQTASQLAEACRTVPGFLSPIARTGTLALASPSCAYKPDDYPCPLDMGTYAILLQDAAERVHDVAGERMALVLDQMRERVTGLRVVEVRRKGQLALRVEDLAVAGKRETRDVRRVHPLDPTLLQLALQTCMVVHCARAIRRWMSGADVWEDREDMLDRLWDRFRETEPPSVSHPWRVLTTQHLQELSSSCGALPYSYGTPTLSPAHTPSHLLAASVAAVMLLAGVPEAFTRLFCSRYRGTLASLLDNARALREALGVMGADASEEVEVVVKEQEAEEGSKSQDIGVDEATLDDEAAQSLAETMDSQEREKTHGDDGREIEKGHDIAPEDKRGHDSGNEQVQEKGKGKEKDAEEAQSTADGEENTGDGEKEEPQKNRDEEEKETEREKSEGISKNPEEDVIPEDELAPPQAEQQPKAKAPQQQQENSKTQKEPTQPKNTKTVQCWRASYFEVRVPDAYGDGLVDTETMEDECAHADVDVDMDGAAAAVSILGMTALGLARVDFERGEHEREVRRAEVMLVRPRVVSENILGWTGQERDGVDGDVMMGVA